LNKNYSLAVKEDIEDDAGLLMLQIINLWRSCHNKALKKRYGLTHVQYVVLLGLYCFTMHYEGSITQTMLAKQAKIDPMTLSHIVKGLEAKGYISRIIHPIDVRAKAVALTREGKELMDKAVNAIVDIDRKFFKTLGKDADRFNKYLKKLLSPNG
jgi:DNA-binding MarR family transcriptional regulator